MQDIDARLERSILDKHAEEIDGSTSPIDVTALPEEYQQLILEAKKRAVAAGALDPSYLIPQLDGEDDEVWRQKNQLFISIYAFKSIFM
jgi:hypothetical protein